MIIMLVLSVLNAWLWTACLLFGIGYATHKAIKTRRREFFIPLILYFAIWGVCRIAAEVELAQVRADMPVFTTSTPPKNRPDTIVIEGSDGGPSLSDLKDMGFRYMITGGVTDTSRVFKKIDLESKRGGNYATPEKIETLPVPRLMFTSRKALQFLPERAPVTKKYARKIDGGPWEIIYVDEQGKKSLIAYHWEPFVPIPAFFPIPTLHVPLLVPFLAKWRHQGNAMGSNEIAEKMTAFLEDGL